MTSPLLFGAIADWISNWLTSLWLLGIGSLLGLAVLLGLWFVLYLISRLPALGTLADPPSPGERNGSGGRKLLRPIAVLFSRRTVSEVPSAIREGVLWPVFLITASLAAFAIVGVVFVQDPAALLSSLKRLPFVGSTTVTVQVPVSEPEDAQDEFSDLVAHQVPLAFRADEARKITFRSTQDLTIATRPFHEVKPGAALDVIADEDLAWLKTEQAVNPFFESDVEQLYVRNLGSAPASVTITVEAAPPHPEVSTIPMTAAGVLFVFLAYLVQRAVAPRLSAIALATYKSEVAQPLFLIILALGIVSSFLFVIIPYNTFGEDIKMLKDSGLTLIMILSIIQAVWAASTSVADEIEGRTALTVLSKPIGRRSFIIGKYLGIVWTVALLFIALGLVLLIAVAYKPIYDGREASTDDATWQLCHMEAMYTVPGLVLAFMETVVLAGLSVAISTRLPLLANFVISFSVYILGHLVPLIAQSSSGQNVFVKFFGQLTGTVLPVLDHFNVQAAVAGGAAVPSEYLWWTFIYCSIFSVIAMLLALILFEDRDLA